MYKGTKFNSRKEDVHGKNYLGNLSILLVRMLTISCCGMLGIQIYRFYFRCSNCSAEYTILTDPKNSDYTVESGASRNYEPWREEEESKKLSQRVREEEEKGNAIKALENRQIDSKREMDVLSALDELRSLNARKQKLSFEQVLSALKNSETEDSKKRPLPEKAEEDEIAEEDEEAIRKLFYQQRSKLQRLEELDSSEEEKAEEKSKQEIEKPVTKKESKKLGRLTTGLKIKVKKK